jgi:hypothetical protein
MPGKDNLRKKSKNKQTNTFNKYGKNTTRGMRIKEEKIINQYNKNINNYNEKNNKK